MRPTIALALATIALASPVSAQDLGFKAPAPARDTWIINATIHPVSGPVIPVGSVHLKTDGTIGEILASAPHMDSDFAARHTVIDATGKHVYPGLFGANTQTGLVEINAVRATLDFAETGTVSPEVRAAVAINPDSTIIPVTRSSGVLTVGVIPMGGSIPGRASVVNLEGWTWEDMSVDADVGVVVNWPSMRPQRGWWVTKSAEEQEKERSQALTTIDQAFAAADAYIKASAADPSIATDLRWEAMRSVLSGADPVIIRAEELEQIQSSVAWAVQRKLRPVILGGRDAGSCLDLLKRHNVAVIVAGTHKLPKRVDTGYDEPFRLPAVLEEAGVTWCLATVGGAFETPHERNLPYHAGTAVAYGLARDAAIRAITLAPAKILGVDARLGSIEKGKDATVIITTGDPLEITTNVEHAFVRSRAIDLTNKQRVLNEKYREKYRQLGVKREE